MLSLLKNILVADFFRQFLLISISRFSEKFVFKKLLYVFGFNIGYVLPANEIKVDLDDLGRIF